MENIWYNVYINNYTTSIAIWNFDKPAAIPIYYKMLCSLFIPKTSEDIIDNIFAIFERYKEV